MVKKYLKILAALLAISLILFFVLAPTILEEQMNLVDAHQPYTISEQAERLHRTLVIGDWHADSALWNRDLAKKSDRGHVDIPRLQQGNVALQMLTTVTKAPSGQNYDRNETSAGDNITLLAITQRWPVATWSSLTARAVYQAQKLHDLAERDAQNFRLIRSKRDLKTLFQERESSPSLVGGLIGTEGSHALDGELDNIQLLFDNGFRMMSLQHFFDNKLGGSLHGTSHAGLSDFGRQAVMQMQALSIIIDVAHSSEQVTRDVLAISQRPVVVSHTGFKGHCDSPRNIQDQLMQAIASRGGLIAVGYWEGAICGNHPDNIAEAINYGIHLVGSDHVALGSDFDGTVTTSIDTSELSAITQALLNSGTSEADIRKVMGGNMLRFLGENLPD